VRRVALLLTYILVVSPIGLISRMVRDPMRRRWSHRSRSYWDLLAGAGRSHRN
jgi:hypothetical protein